MAGITGVSPIDARISAVQPLPGAALQPGGGQGDFAALLRQQLDQVAELNNNAELLQRQFAAGEIGDINQVVLAVTKAELALSFALELRNKVIEAYQELSRTQL